MEKLANSVRESFVDALRFQMNDSPEEAFVFNGSYITRVSVAFEGALKKISVELTEAEAQALSSREVESSVGDTVDKKIEVYVID